MLLVVGEWERARDMAVFRPQIVNITCNARAKLLTVSYISRGVNEIKQVGVFTTVWFPEPAVVHLRSQRLPMNSSLSKSLSCIVRTLWSTYNVKGVCFLIASSCTHKLLTLPLRARSYAI